MPSLVSHQSVPATYTESGDFGVEALERLSSKGWWLDTFWSEHKIPHDVYLQNAFGAHGSYVHAGSQNYA